MNLAEHLALTKVLQLEEPGAVIRMIAVGLLTLYVVKYYIILHKRGN